MLCHSLLHGKGQEALFVDHYPANTLRLSRALLAAGRPHEVLLLPGATHDVRDEATSENLHWHEARFLQQHLAAEPPEPP